jgi:sterol desaturase/sphingolipid hydroxylase (fatty acid hydroxylase superfamily)
MGKLMSDTGHSKPPQLPGWNHVPQVPIQVSPFFAWPPSPRRMVDWVTVRWFRLAENSILSGLAVVCWFWLQPSLETTKTLSFDWVFLIWLRNMVLMFLVAGGLHWFFHGAKRQGDRLKYDPRDLAQKGKQFTFGGQVRDNAFWTLTSGVGVWTAFEVLMFWAMGNGYAPVLFWADNPVWFVLLFF